MFLAITLKVLLSRKMLMNSKAASNKDTVKYDFLHNYVLVYDYDFV